MLGGYRDLCLSRIEHHLHGAANVMLRLYSGPLLAYNTCSAIMHGLVVGGRTNTETFRTSCLPVAQLYNKHRVHKTFAAAVR